MRLPLQFSSRMMKTLRKAALTRTIEGYAGRSSIHGIGYVFDRDINIVDRLLWLFVVIAFIGGAAMLTWNFWSQWRDEQVGDSPHLTVACELVGCDDPEGHKQACN